MVYVNKIEAIKAVRVLGHDVHVSQNAAGEWVLQGAFDLKTCKDLVEAIMELGKSELRNSIRNSLDQLNAAVSTDIRF